MFIETWRSEAIAASCLAQPVLADCGIGAHAGPLCWPMSVPIVTRPAFPVHFSSPLHEQVGQFIASSPTIFPAEYVKEFQKCLDRTDPIPWSKSSWKPYVHAPLPAVQPVLPPFEQIEVLMCDS